MTPPHDKAEMHVMFRPIIAMATMAGTLVLAAPTLAQGVAPGGPIAGSTGIGSGWGNNNPGSTAPTWPNGTNQAPQPVITSVPPGGAPLSSTGPATSQPSAISPSATSVYRQPSTAPTQRPPSIVPLTLPSATPDVALLRGCWRTDVFVYERHTGITTWCFNEKGAGRVLYSRIDQPGYACNALAQARSAGRGLVLTSLPSTCSDGRALALGDLDCRQNGEVTQCSGSLPQQGPGETWSVGLYRVQR